MNNSRNVGKVFDPFTRVIRKIGTYGVQGTDSLFVQKDEIVPTLESTS